MKKIFIIFTFFCIAVTSLFASDLRITEVFVDGSDEWVEISNIGSDTFVGSLILSGVKSTPLLISTTTIPGLSSLVIGDNLSMLSTFATIQVLTGRGLSLGDTSPIDIVLSQGNTVFDTFFVSGSLVQSMDNTMTSFQKLWNGGGFDVLATLSPFSSGVISPSLANPGKVYNTDGSLWFPLTIPVSTGSVSTGSLNTGSVTTGSLGTGILVTGSITTGIVSSGVMIDCTSVRSGIVVIDEVYNGSLYSHYIELLFAQDRSGSLQLSGTALISGLILPIQSFRANTRYLVVTSNSGFVHTDNIIISSSLNIGSRGSLSVGIVGSPLSYYANIDNTGQSVYYGNMTTCIQNITSMGNPSPGFDRQFLGYLNTQTLTNTIVQASTGTCGGSTGSVPLVNTGSNLGSGSTPSLGSSGLNILSGMITFRDVRISLIDYDPIGSDTNNERIGLTLSTGDFVSLSGWSLGYDGKTYKFLSGMMMSGTEYIRTGNFGFVNSRTVCISLYYLGMVIDTVCYDPTIQNSPVYPLVIPPINILTGSASTGNISTGSLSMIDDEMFDYSSLQFDIISLIYDPDGSDTDRESIVIKFLSGTDSVLLDNFRLRVGTTNKRIYGTILSGQTLTLIGNFQMPNTKATCVALSYNEIIYDEYCYTPPISTPSQQTQTPDKPKSIEISVYTSRIITLLGLQYDPDGNDTDRETVTLLMTGGQASVDLSKLYLRFGTTKRALSGMLYPDAQTLVTGNFQMPNSKSTCVDLMEGNHIFDTYCYDPLVDDKKPQSTGDIQTGSLVILQDRKDYYSGVQLQRILPNPKDKDIKNTNEKFALSRPNSSGHTLTKHIKVLVGKTSISLSGYQFIDNTLIITSPKSLTNQAACVRLMVDNKQLDVFCYPQAKEGIVYYHPRLQIGPQTIPSSLIDSLDAQGVDLSALRLKKIGKKICLTYEKVSIRCMNGGSTTTSAKNKALLRLGNNYIKKMSELVYAKKMDYVLMEQWRTSYRALSDKIKSGKLGDVTLYGQSFKVTDIDSYVTSLYALPQDQYMLDQVAHIFFGHQALDNYYRQLYK